jgi:hypothetical protein
MRYKMYHILQLIMWHILHPLQFDTLKKKGTLKRHSREIDLVLYHPKCYKVYITFLLVKKCNDFAIYAMCTMWSLEMFLSTINV